MENAKEVALSVNWVSKQIAKFGQLMAIDDDVWKMEVEDKIPQIWHNVYDQIRFFNYNTDGTFLCEKRIKIPSKSDPSVSVWKNYVWYNVVELDGKEIYKMFRACYEAQEKKNEEKVLLKLSNSSGSVESLGIENIKELRTSLLYESDWRFTTDTQINSIELEMWKVYRQKLRDLPKDNESIENVLEWKIPITPTQFLEQEKAIENHLNDDSLRDKMISYLESESYIIKQPYLSVSCHYCSYSIFRDSYPEQQFQLKLKGYFSIPSKNVLE